MNKIILICILALVTGKSFGQDIPSDYPLLTKIDKQDGLPSEILVDSTISYLAILYELKPSYVEVYSTENWERIQTVKFKKPAYLFSSYFSLNNELYIAHSKNKYRKVNLQTNETTDLDCSETPHGCYYFDELNTKMKLFEETKTVQISNEKYILISNPSGIKIYLNKKQYDLQH